MARNVLYIGDRNPSLPATLVDGSGAVLNLTSHTVQFALRLQYDTSNSFKNAAVVVSAVAGSVRYDFGVSDLVGLTAGIYDGQWIDTDGSGKVMHLDAGEFEVRASF